MAVKRTRWRCPECGRRYAIPADLPRPTLCPKCQAAHDEQVDHAEQSEPSPAAIASADEDRRDFAGAKTEPAIPPATTIPPFAAESPQVSTPTIEPPPIGQTVSASRYRRKYPALRTLVFVYRALAGLIFVGAFFAFVYAIISVFSAESQPARWAAVMLGLGALGGGTFVGVSVLAFGELIRLLLDIEQNTRPG